MPSLSNIFWLGTKELRSFRHDYVLFGLIVWAFSFSLYVLAQNNTQELRNASIAICDEDHSELSRRVAAAFLPPYFQPARAIGPAAIDQAMDTGRFTFVLDIPPDFERDLRAGRRPAIQAGIDATAVIHAGIGAGYIEEIIQGEIARYLDQNGKPEVPPVTLAVRVAFNPNVTTSWFTSVMGLINNVTMLAIIIAGAAIVREREHGTMDHLLVMPLTPLEIAMAKIWANGLVIAVAVVLSLYAVIRGLLGIPIAGSVPLFMLGVVLYLFFATAIGIFLGTIARSMPQLGLLFMLVAVPMNVLSGSNTPLESMPPFLQSLMQLSPSTHFVSFAQAILYRGAGIEIVWPEFLAIALMGGVFLLLTLARFRRIAVQTG